MNILSIIAELKELIAIVITLIIVTIIGIIKKKIGKVIDDSELTQEQKDKIKNKIDNLKDKEEGE